MGSWYRKTPRRWMYTTPIKAPLQASATLRSQWACNRPRRRQRVAARGVSKELSTPFHKYARVSNRGARTHACSVHTHVNASFRGLDNVGVFMKRDTK